MIRYKKSLERLQEKHRYRELSPIRGIDFTSNDYLALANSPRIKNAIKAAIDQGIPVGAGGSRLLRGNHDIFEQLERTAATFFQSERSLYFANGYTANMAIFATLPRKNDIVIYDELVHASILDGIKASRAHAISVKHNDIDEFNKTIKQSSARPWIAVESLYSMDGDRAPLTELLDLAIEHNGFLVIDEAHATGVFGEQGEGLATHHENVITLHTCGKALGVSGALVCLNNTLCDYLINRARPFIYSTAPSPLMAVAVLEALKILTDEPEHRAKLKELYTYAGAKSQILPIIIGKDKKALDIANHLQKAGYDIRAIRPPTVPEGSARLRISMTLHVTKNDIRQMFNKLEEKLTCDDLLLPAPIPVLEKPSFLQA